jgi:hypothetical protein
MTIKIIKGATEYNGIPYWSGTSQDTITDIDEKDGQRLIDLGFAERVSDPPKPPLQIFPDSPDKIRGKIAELEAKLAEAEAEHEGLISSDDLQDVSGITKKIDSVNGRISSLRSLIERQQAKLKKAEEAAEIENEKAAVKNLKKATKEHRTEAEKILNGILDAVAALEAKVGELNGLKKRVRDNFYSFAPRMFPSRSCPLLNGMEFPEMWKAEIDSIRAYMNGDLALLDAVAAQTPVELKSFYNSRRFKTAEQLEGERRLREKERLAEPTVTTAEARSLDWKTFPENAKQKQSSVGREQTPQEYAGQRFTLSGSTSSSSASAEDPMVVESILN